MKYTFSTDKSKLRNQIIQHTATRNKTSITASNSITFNNNTYDKYINWIVTTSQSAARDTSANSRLMDALTSLDFLIVEESKQGLSMEKVSSLMSVLTVISKVIPSSSSSVYDKIIKWLNTIDSIETAERGWSTNVADVIKTRSNTNEYVWKVCGVTSSLALSQSTHGYTCGLWLLMHHLTVASETKHIVSAVGVMNTIRSLSSSSSSSSSSSTSTIIVI